MHENSGDAWSNIPIFGAACDTTREEATADGCRARAATNGACSWACPIVINVTVVTVIHLAAITHIFLPIGAA